MSSCWLIEIVPSREALERLRQLGMVAFETTSWRYLSGRTPALRNLLDKSGVLTYTREDTFHVVSLLMDLRESRGSQLVDIQDYFYELVGRSLDQAGMLSIRDDDLPDVLVLNLMPFYPRAAIADRAVQGVCRAIEQVTRLSNTCLVFLVRTHLGFSRNIELKQLVQSGSNPNRAVIIDRDGVCMKLERNARDSRNEPHIHRIQIPRSIFEEVLRLDEDSFRRVLVYQTNINIGHFDIGTSHVRTHYDLTDFVSRDNAFEHLYDKFCSSTGDFYHIKLITAGLEKKALTVLANRLESWTANEPSSVFGKSEKKRVVKWIGHFSHDEVRSKAHEVKDHVRDSDCILVLTDIVNSGSTVLGVREGLEQVLYDVKKTSAKSKRNITIKTFAVARMSNSPNDIEAAVTIRRPYYVRDQAKCPLCLLGQPLKEVTADTWEQDFRYVDPIQPTPLDFWEMVQDCNGLRQRETYLGGKRLTHRIDTKRIIERYSHWLANVVRRKYLDVWGSNLPDIIVVVSEEAGFRFGELVDRALRPHRCRIIDIPRPVLDGIQDAPEVLVKELRLCKEQQWSALLVDDGINLGGTARKLCRFIQEHEVIMLGMLVLDNRLNRAGFEKLGIESTNHPLVALYTWPSYPVEVS